MNPRLLKVKSDCKAVLRKVSATALRLWRGQSEVAYHGAASCKGAALATRFPTDVVTGGRRYVVGNSGELNELLGWLDSGRLALANRYRVGPSWPRGNRVVPRKIATTWRCRDCQRTHRAWTLACTISARPRTICEAMEDNSDGAAVGQPSDLRR